MKPMSSISSASSSTKVRRFEVQRVAAHVVHDAAGRADHDLDAALERAQLALDRLAAVDRQDRHRLIFAVRVQRLGDLHRQLARRRQNQRLRRAVRGSSAR